MTGKLKDIIYETLCDNPKLDKLKFVELIKKEIENVFGNEIHSIVSHDLLNFDGNPSSMKPDIGMILKSEQYQQLLNKIISQISYSITQINRDLIYDDADAVFISHFYFFLLDIFMGKY